MPLGNVMETASERRHFLEYWRVLQSRKEIVIAVTLTIVIAGWLVTLSMPKTYMASTRIAVRNVAADLPAFPGAQDYEPQYNPFFLKTQIEMIKSQLVLDKVISNLGLQDRFAKARRMPMGMTTADTRRELLQCMRVTCFLDTNIIKIDVYRNAPKETVTQDVMDIGNAIADVYRSVSTDTNKEKTERGLIALEEEYARYEKQVLAKEKDVEDLRKKLNIVSMSRVSGKEGSGDGDRLEQLRLQELESNRIQARKTMTEKKVKLEKLKSLSGESAISTLAYLMNDPALSSLRREMTTADLKLRDLEETCGERHPDVVRQKAVIQEMNKQLSEAMAGAGNSLQTDYEIAKQNFESIEQELNDEKQKDIAGSGERYLPFYKANDELLDLRKLRDALKMRVIEERIGLELPQTPVKTVDYAEKPEDNEYVGPSLLINLALSILLGLCCGVGLAFFFEYVDTSVKNIDEIEKYLGVPVLGIVPQKVKILLDAGEGSPYAEAYRVLRTNIQFAKKMGKGKALCATSAGAGEGKSFTICNLGCVSANLGDRVLIIDSDLRRPRQHKIFNVDRKPGLADVLRGDVKLEEAVRTTKIPNLFMLPSGRAAEVSMGLLDTDRMRDLIDYLKGQFDLLLFDAPPIVGVSDASVLVSKVDAVLLVIQHRGYPREMSMRAKQIIDNVGGNLIGVVFNNINVTKDSYYYHHYYRYYYGAYGYGRDGKEKAVGELVEPKDVLSREERI